MKLNKLIGAALLAGAASIWGGMFVVVKTAVNLIPPVELVWLRYTVAAVTLGIFLLIRRPQWHWDRKNGRLIILCGLIGNALSICFQETGTWLSSAQLGAVVTTTTPAFMVLFAWWLLRVRPRRGDWLSLVLAMAGILVIVGWQFSGRRLLWGAICLLIAALTWALMSVLLQLIDPKYDALQVTFLAVVVAWVTLTPWVIYRWPATLGQVHLTATTVMLQIGYLGAVSTALAFVMWNAGLRRFNSNLSGLFFLFQPVVGALLGWLCLGEPLTHGFFVGMVMLVASFWVALREGN